jgi:hypothetical protein
MDEDSRDQRIEALRQALLAVSHEAAVARSALCENELVIRLDNILALARAALAEADGGNG